MKCHHIQPMDTLSNLISEIHAHSSDREATNGVQDSDRGVFESDVAIVSVYDQPLSIGVLSLSRRVSVSSTVNDSHSSNRTEHCLRRHRYPLSGQ